MKKLVLLAFLVGACDVPDPIQFDQNEEAFAGYKSDSAYSESGGNPLSGVVLSGDQEGYAQVPEEAAPGKQVSNSAVSDLIRFSAPVGTQQDALKILAVEADPSITSVVYMIQEGLADDAFEIASSKDVESGFLVAQTFSFKGQLMIGAIGYDESGLEVATAWKGMYLNNGVPGVAVPPAVEFVTSEGAQDSNPVVLMAVSQGDVHSVRYVCSSSTGDVEWNLGESFDPSAGYGVSFHFSDSTDRTILARALNQAGEIVAEDSIQINVAVPFPNNALANGAGCETGKSMDCNGSCVPAIWLGDGYCDAGGLYNADFACEQFGFDGGDCDGSVVELPVDDCPSGHVMDCGGVCASLSWLGDGVCDDGTKYVVDFSCEQFGGDQGDCDLNAGTEAESNSPSPVPYFYQYENEYYPSQSGTISSLTMLLVRYGYHGTPDDLLLEYGVSLSHSPFGLADIFDEVAEANGLTERLVPVQNGNVEGLKILLAAGKPVLVHGLFESGGHAVVVTDYKAGSFTVNDPKGEWNQAFKGAYPFGWNSTVGQGINYDESAFELAISSTNGYNTVPVQYYEIVD